MSKINIPFLKMKIVKITDGSYTLSEGVDYNLTYDTDFINAGEKNILRRSSIGPIIPLYKTYPMVIFIRQSVILNQKNINA